MTVRNMQNHLVHDLISTKLCCSQHRLVVHNVVLYARSGAQRSSHVPCEQPKNKKCRGRPPLVTDIGLPCAPWYTMQVVHNVVLYC